MKSVYLCGPINGCTDEECNNWRDAVKEAHQNCIDPMVRDYRGREDECYKEIVELDKIDVAVADIILVNYVKPSVGTSMEVLLAWMLHKPIILWCAPDANLSPWMRYHVTYIVHSLGGAIEVINS